MMLNCGNTHGYQLLKAGELESFLDGRSRKITVEFIRQYIARKVAAAGAIGAATEEVRATPPSRPAAQIPRARDPDMKNIPRRVGQDATGADEGCYSNKTLTSLPLNFQPTSHRPREEGGALSWKCTTG